MANTSLMQRPTITPQARTNIQPGPRCTARTPRIKSGLRQNTPATRESVLTQDLHNSGSHRHKQEPTLPNTRTNTRTHASAGHAAKPTDPAGLSQPRTEHPGRLRLLWVTVTLSPVAAISSLQVASPLGATSLLGAASPLRATRGRTFFFTRGRRAPAAAPLVDPACLLATLRFADREREAHRVRPGALTGTAEGRAAQGPAAPGRLAFCVRHRPPPDAPLLTAQRRDLRAGPHPPCASTSPAHPRPSPAYRPRPSEPARLLPRYIPPKPPLRATHSAEATPCSP